MSEMALVSSRKTRLTQWADEGRRGARAALRLAEEPSHFLSTIQVGITAIGILSGIFGEAALARPLAEWLSQFDALQRYATAVSVGIVVVAITTLSLIIGELVPKRLALANPEAIASIVARPMGFLSIAAFPLVRGLSAVTEAIIRLFGVHRRQDPPVTEDEIHVLMAQGRQAGIFDPHEESIVRRAFALDEERVTAVMTPLRDLNVVRLDDEPQVVRETIRRHVHSRFPVVDERGEVVGLLRTKRVVDRLLAGAAIDVASLMEPGLYVPRSSTITRLLKTFKSARQQSAFVVDEYGHTLGLVTLNDVLLALVGHIGEVDEVDADPEIVVREDGSWLMSGSVSISDFREATGARADLPEEDEERYDTLGGLAMTVLQAIPRVGDRFETDEFRFEIVDMDQHRVDKLLVVRRPEAQTDDVFSRD